MVLINEMRYNRDISSWQKYKKPKKVIGNNLSKYGYTNYSEFFAEFFANSQLGSTNELGKAMNEWLKNRGF
ncbi:MAG: hypothetical protein MR314_02360 [Ezakiella sp.]|nr:hypothetical protein [Ezakiella sp.]